MFTVSLCIFRGTPLDTAISRPTGILLTRGPFTSYMTVLGTLGVFAFSERLDYDPRKDKMLAGAVTLGELPRDVGYEAVKVVVQTVRIREKDPEFSCQTWCAEVLERFVELGWMTGERREMGVEGMVGWMLRGEDEGRLAEV